MKVTYIYLNTYENGYMYIGSHTWDGELGKLDPKYHGSSNVALRYGWKPIKEEFLCQVYDNRLSIEKNFIEEYCEKYGIADAVYGVCQKRHLSWFTKFKQHGLMLNAHSNEPPHDHEAMVKSHLNRNLNGNAGNMSQCHTVEARQKRLTNIKNSGALKRFIDSGHKKAYSEQALLKKRATLIRQGKAKLCRCTFYDGRIIEDTCRRLCERIGKPGLRQKLSKEGKVIRKEFILVVL